MTYNSFPNSKSLEIVWTTWTHRLMKGSVIIFSPSFWISFIFTSISASIPPTTLSNSYYTFSLSFFPFFLSSFSFSSSILKALILFYKLSRWMSIFKHPCERVNIKWATDTEEELFSSRFSYNFLMKTSVSFSGLGEILYMQVSKCSLTEYQSWSGFYCELTKMHIMARSKFLELASMIGQVLGSSMMIFSISLRM